ncbi:hypothetical protein POJ06DRAFT_263139 [Lipomyces tetrasporus]|uniref:Uncharacterized protein n=1 Tax=Lipomyces tetrasporus TaxID=54092 RepID=A0AAD7QKQ5_9ASCO|nr:uncharacterized protein POJ06DRAFT_263139 [Lipomyces tetrasporus]KAJ8096690.1 hypothetical protein POJ06DRAFT_263139 [Lipomyces tetrasporus]
MDTKYNLNMEFLDSASTILLSIPALTKPQSLHPRNIRVRHLNPCSFGCLVARCTSENLIKSLDGDFKCILFDHAFYELSHFSVQLLESGIGNQGGS